MSSVMSTGPGITASFGVAELTPNDDIGDAIKRADEALYAAKNGGRDRVVVDMALDGKVRRSMTILR